MSLLGAAEAGEPQLAVVKGPPGIGKTRLAEEAADRARRRGCRVGVGRCWQDGDAPPFWPWRAILRDLAASERLLEERPVHANGRFARFVTVLNYLRDAPGAAPCVIVLDDAHRADPASLLLARFLTRERRLPLLLLLTAREELEGAPAEVLDLLSELSRDAAAIRLLGLSEEAVGEFLDALGAPPPDPETRHAVAVVTKGNPLHLRSVTVESQLGGGGVVGGLEHAIGHLIAGLPDADRRLIAVSALLDPEVSVHEIAWLADTTPVLAAESLARAADLGLAAELEGGRFRFVHELVRRAAVSSLATSDRLEAHARAATLPPGHEPARIARRAHHALAAASRSKEDAERAVAIAREAASMLRALDGFELAAVLRGRAVETHAAAALTSPAAELIVEQAEAVLACGRLAESRPLFQHAARTAEKERAPLVLARAALGLGGVWVSEHRLASDAERVLALQRRALEELPVEETVLRARLAVRLAAEEVYRGGTVAAVLEAVEGARRTRNPNALAEALSLAHQPLLIPEQTWRRPALAKELIAAAAEAENGLLSLIGLCWHAGDLLLLGDPGAVAALAELRLRADALGCRSVLFIVRAQEVMLAIRGGDFEKAEAAAAACFAQGQEVGDADALAYHGAHLSAIRFFQGREAELAPLAASLAESPTLIAERERRAFASAAALFALRAGRPERASSLLQRLAREGMASIPSSSSWLTTLLAVVELASALGDARIAQAAYDSLLPYADLPLMASLGIVCFGSVHRCLGLAASTCGKLDLAIEHFAAAVAANGELGHRPAAIQAQAELGIARLRHGSKGDEPRGQALLRDAITAGEAVGMNGLVARWREAAEAVPSAGAAAQPEAALMTRAEAGTWRVVFEGRVATVPDRVGMQYLAQLIAAPDRGIPALALVVQGAIEPEEHGADPVMDRKAVMALRERIRQLRAQAALASHERDELGALTRELARAAGLGGRMRSFVDAPERARTAVRKAIKRAIDEISLNDAAVGEHLARRIETGAVCCYRLQTGRSIVRRSSSIGSTGAQFPGRSPPRG
jgi:hypothetical protein